MLTLSPAELHELTGKRRSDAQRRALEFMGIPHRVRPDGTPVVLRAALAPVAGATMPAPEPELLP